MPPSAAIAGRATARRSRSSPTTSSRLISMPTTKKNTAINKSLTTWARSSSNRYEPIVDADRRRPQRLVAGLPRRVRPHQCDRSWRRRAGCRRPLRCAGTARPAGRRGRGRDRCAGSVGLALRTGGRVMVLLGVDDERADQASRLSEPPMLDGNGTQSASQSGDIGGGDCSGRRRCRGAPGCVSGDRGPGIGGHRRRPRRRRRR